MAGSLFSQKTNSRLYNWYRFMAFYCRFASIPVDFMNLGYVDDTFIPKVKLTNQDKEVKRYRQIALYLKLLQRAPIDVNSALEVACGFGGGVDVIHRYYHPKFVMGVDKLKLSVNFCKQKFEKVGVVEFETFTAENINKINQSFDMVVCLEASQHFADWLSFYKSVCKLLNSDGVFFYGDIFDKKDVALAELYIAQAGLKILREEDISGGVLKSIDRIRPNAGFFGFVESLLLNRHDINFNSGSTSYRRLLNGELVFMIYEIRKVTEPSHDT